MFTLIISLGKFSNAWHKHVIESTDNEEEIYSTKQKRAISSDGSSDEGTLLIYY